MMEMARLISTTLCALLAFCHYGMNNISGTVFFSAMGILINL